MPDWTGPRYDAAWTYRRIKWGTWEDLGEYQQVSGMTLNRSAFDSLKTSGSISYVGEPVDEVDALAAYYGFTDSAGERVEMKVATVLVEADDPELRSLSSGGIHQYGTAKFYSLLKVLSDAKCKAPLTVPAGANAIAKAKEMIEGCGLRTNAQESAYMLAADHTFDSSDSLLTVINWLLDAAGYLSASTDADGAVVLTPYVEPTARATTWSFANDESSTMYVGMTSESDWRDAPNVVTLRHETDTVTITATAKNIDPDSKSSLPNRGWRENGMTDSVSELQGETIWDRVSALKRLARKKLIDNSSEIRCAKFATLFVPLHIGDAVDVDYSGEKWSGTVTALDTDGGPAGKTTVKVRQFVRRELLIKTDGEIMC